jgi:predicted transcriptional regulator
MNNDQEPTPAEQAQFLEWAGELDPQAAALLKAAMKREFAEDPTQPPLQLLTAHDILTTDWPEPVWAIPNLLPVGLTILAGRPKVGKSWLALQIALAVASGGYALGEPVEKGPVLYLALEDPPRRLEERMTKQGWTGDLPAEFMPLDKFQRQIADLRDGGGERLARQIELKGYRLVVIDTLSRSVYGDQNDVAEMTLALTPIQEMAHSLNCAVLLVDHHRKTRGADLDAITDILGSTAKGAMADTAWGLYRESGKVNAKLVIIGRDVEEQILALSWDGELGCWHCEGDAHELELTERRQEILDVVEELGRVGVVDIADAVDRNKGNVCKDLADLVNHGFVVKTGKGRNKVKYSLSEKGKLLQLGN